MAARKRILVTGGAGFIGANLVRVLLGGAHDVTVLDNLETGQRAYVDGLPVELIEGDILDSNLLSRVVPGHDAVVHLAAQTGVPGSLADPRRDCTVNVLGTLNLLEAFRHAVDGVHAPAQGGSLRGQSPIFVFASSNAPLGRQTPPATEEKAPLPVSPYGASKLAGEAYCLAYHGSWGLRTVVLRFANVYGPFSAHKQSVVAKFLRDITTCGTVTVHGDGGQTRDFLYVGDLCRAVLLALEGDVAGEVFQVASGIETPILELARLVQATLGERAAVYHGEARQGDMRRNYATIGKIRRVLGWSPETSLEQGLRLTQDWFASWSRPLVAG